MHAGRWASSPDHVGQFARAEPAKWHAWTTALRWCWDFAALVSQSAMERVDIRLSADGIYTVTVTLDAEAVEQGTMLTLAGFRPVAGGYRLVQKGRF